MTLTKLEDRCRQIELVLSDVDGVLTDGGIVYGRFIEMNAASMFVSAFISGVHSVSPER